MFVDFMTEPFLSIVSVKLQRVQSHQCLSRPSQAVVPSGSCRRCIDRSQPNLLHKSHNAPVPYPTVHHFVTEMCRYVHISVKKICIVGYLPSALWDLWHGSIVDIGIPSLCCRLTTAFYADRIIVCYSVTLLVVIQVCSPVADVLIPSTVAHILIFFSSYSYMSCVLNIMNTTPPYNSSNMPIYGAFLLVNTVRL